MLLGLLCLIELCMINLTLLSYQFHELQLGNLALCLNFKHLHHPTFAVTINSVCVCVSLSLSLSPPPPSL
jgi:hypothetical protein